MGQPAWNEGEVVQGALKLCPMALQHGRTKGCPRRAGAAKPPGDPSIVPWAVGQSLSPCPGGTSLTWHLSSEGNSVTLRFAVF